MDKVGDRVRQHVIARIPELAQKKLVRFHNPSFLDNDETRRQRMQKHLCLIQGFCGFTIFLAEQSDLVSQALLVRPHSGDLFLKAIFVFRRHGRHRILRFLEVLKERPKTISPLEVRVVPREVELHRQEPVAPAAQRNPPKLQSSFAKASEDTRVPPRPRGRGFLRRRMKLRGLTLHHEKGAVNPLMKTS